MQTTRKPDPKIIPKNIAIDFQCVNIYPAELIDDISSKIEKCRPSIAGQRNNRIDD